MQPVWLPMLSANSELNPGRSVGFYGKPQQISDQRPDSKFGYGLIDALAAVREAKKDTSSPTL